MYNDRFQPCMIVGYILNISHDVVNDLRYYQSFFRDKVHILSKTLQFLRTSQSLILENKIIIDSRLENKLDL